MKLLIISPDMVIDSSIGGSITCMYHFLNTLFKRPNVEISVVSFTKNGQPQKSCPPEFLGIIKFFSFSKLEEYYQHVEEFNPSVCYLLCPGSFKDMKSPEEYFKVWQRALRQLTCPIVIGSYSEESYYSHSIYLYDTDLIKGTIFSEPGIKDNYKNYLGYELNVPDVVCKFISDANYVDVETRTLHDDIVFTSRPLAYFKSLKNLLNVYEVAEEKPTIRVYGLSIVLGDLSTEVKKYKYSPDVLFHKLYKPSDLPNIFNFAKFHWNCFASYKDPIKNITGRIENVSIEAIQHGVLPVLNEKVCRREFRDNYNAIVIDGDSLYNDTHQNYAQVVYNKLFLMNRPIYNLMVNNAQKTCKELFDNEKNLDKVLTFLSKF